MDLNEEGIMFAFLDFDDGFLVEERHDEEKFRSLVDFDDSEKGCKDVDKLPNDPFGMEFDMGMSEDPLFMDFNPDLPTDPFGMDLDATFAAISALMEDFGHKTSGFEEGRDSDNGFEEGGGSDNGSSNFCSELNFGWSGSMEYEGECRENDIGPVMYMEDGSYGECSTMSGGDKDDLMCFGCEKYGTEHVKSESDGGVDVIIFVLQYLDFGIKDLLSIERVCRSLRDAVLKDPFLWTSIHIDCPLSFELTNEDLLRLTNRAQGKLCSLSLIACINISNDGLKQVLNRNLELTKLSVAGSIKINGKEVLNMIKVFNSVAMPGIKHLRIGDPNGITSEHLNEYKLLLGAYEEAGDYKPRFYGAAAAPGEMYLSLDDERAIDIEICPICQQVKHVFDCPNDNCQAKIDSTRTCRACIYCIARCVRCGCCLDNKAYEETFYCDFLCFDCLEELLFEDGITLSAGQAYVERRASYHFFVYS
ncbi:F-box protein At3g27290-like [Salvia hispanica]|uniref:F-box protein At3g27290-like n=1 Tax=Salvia hispanica TaxID=49212 RepID=UPI0020093C71|nr:F-box protein At3g27290-like [Salvia hispanica]XP_047945974.1 F-box protein At3g27290-like [Salvia hispanica]XP_047945976.1 F-box protein At3g27290-like [Salvia hispanica]